MLNKPSILAFLLLTGVLLPLPLHAGTDGLNSDSGIIHLLVKDQNGVTVPEARVYISEAEKIVGIVETDGLGAASVDLQQGHYVINASKQIYHQDYIDRFASRESKIQVNAQDVTSVILTLLPVDDPIQSLSLSALKKMGVADEVAKYTN